MGLFMLFFSVCLPILYTFIYFILFLWKRKKGILWINLVIQLITFLVLPLTFYDMDARGLDCCGDTAFFSPEHVLSIKVLEVICTLAFFYSFYRKRLGPPLLEIYANCLLLIGIALNVVMLLHTKAGAVSTMGPEFYTDLLIGHFPIILWLLISLIHNHRLILEYAEQGTPHHKNKFMSIGLKILLLPPLQKYPLLLLLCLPVLMVLSLTLLIFGQKPDSLIKAFTNTYKYGLSELSCEGVICPDPGGHFLCTIASKGHKKFVKPTRAGIRWSGPITVNRQLLISNAFEELLQEKSPWLHKPIRKIYNKIGGSATLLHNLLGNKWISDIVYIIMKPLEWFFLFVLYFFCNKPENRINWQYLSAADRKAIKELKGER
jgi:hypothetical protein